MGNFSGEKIFELILKKKRSQSAMWKAVVEQELHCWEWEMILRIWKQIKGQCGSKGSQGPGGS